MKIWERIAAEPWAITEDKLALILSIAERHHDDDIEAIQTKLGRPLANTRTVTVRDGVAIIPVSGPIFRYANIFTAISGATATEILATDIRVALDDPSIKAIILNMDSPGGMVNGTAEMAETIFAGRKTKPIYAYVDGMAASAAYWLASAATKIVASKTAEVGSIGVIGTFAADKPQDGAYRFISSQSPHKRIDPGTSDGASMLQARIDAIADIFIGDVARFRGVTPDVVQSDFGRGGVLMAAEALAAGMIDSLGTFENLLTSLAVAVPGRSALNPRLNAKENLAMSETTTAAPVINAAYLRENHPDVVASLVAEGAAAERQRLADIDAVTLPGLEKVAEACKADPNCTAADAAMKMVAAAKEPGNAYLASQRRNDSALPAVPPAVDTNAADAARAAADAAAEADLPLKDRLEVQWKRDPSIRAEFGDNFEAFLAYEEQNQRGNVRVLRQKVEG